MKIMMIVLLLLTASAGTLRAQQHNYTPGDIEEGGRLYRINCIGCHGPEGNLVGGIDLGRNRFRRVSSDDEIVDVIMNGVPGTGMPPNAIVRLRAYNVVAYLRSMNDTSGVKSSRRPRETPVAARRCSKARARATPATVFSVRAPVAGPT